MDTGSVFVYLGLAICLAFILACIFYMFYVNRYGKTVTREQQKPRTKLEHYVIFFFQHLFLEVVGLIFTIFGIIGMETNPWGTLDIRGLRIAFYLFTVLKYILVIISMWIEHKDEHFRYKVATRLRIRADWPEICAAVIFIPAAIIDGLGINAEYHIGQIEDVFPYDGVILFILDASLYCKEMIAMIVEAWTEEGKYKFDIKNICFSGLSFAYTLSTMMLVIVSHLNSINTTGMKVTSSMLIMLINTLTHFYFSSYSSMIAQNILFLDKLLKKSSNRLDQVKVFIYYFQRTPLMYLVNLICYGYTLFLYIAVWIVTADILDNARPEPFIRTAIGVLLVIANILNAFFMANWAYAVAKRIGVYIGCRSPFDCSAYAQAVNQILSGCVCSFRMDTAMQMRS